MCTISASALWLIDSGAAGIIAHHGLFIKGEWQLRVPRIVLAHLALACIVWSFVPDEYKDPARHLRLCTLMFTSYLASRDMGVDGQMLMTHQRSTLMDHGFCFMASASWLRLQIEDLSQRNSSYASKSANVNDVHAVILLRLDGRVYFPPQTLE